ncbi:hypothetical protein [Dactylosporangium sp. NPDC000521]|uniref:hypothetical protein n=1 Tax=Dactylosporangium sp. NPDC000521 TaxID=3363975 RepID=UPI0036AE95D7
MELDDVVEAAGVAPGAEDVAAGSDELLLRLEAFLPADDPTAAALGDLVEERQPSWSR